MIHNNSISSESTEGCSNCVSNFYFPYSCAEAIAMVQNIKKHLNYIASTIGFVSDQIKADKQILVSAQVCNVL